jgi:hypothetical protein
MAVTDGLPARSAAVMRDVVKHVPGELVGLLDQAAQVVAGQAVEHPASVAAGMNQTDQTQPAQVLRHRGPRRGDLLGEGVHVLLPARKQPQQVQACGVREVAQEVRGKRDLIAHHRLLRTTCYCHVVVRAHGCMMDLRTASWQ